MRSTIVALLGIWWMMMSCVSSPPAHADLCPYPFTGVAANILVGHGGYCDGPTEINGSHMHCEGGGFGIGGVFGLQGADEGGSANFGGGFAGVGGASCTWRCPDNTLSPAPNPPGEWLHYMVPMSSTNFCKDHMDPAGFTSQPVLPTEGQPDVPPPPPADVIPGGPLPIPKVG